MRKHCAARRAFRGSAVIALLLVLSSCGGYYYTATVQGFVKNSGDETGIDGITVRFYQEEPEAADSDGFFAETSTATSGGAPGFYTNRVIWRNMFGRFGAEGDTGTIFLGLSHPDYASDVVQIPAILSDTTNTVRDILLERLSFETPVVRGRVIDTNGDGVNGVRMVLDLASTPDETEDYVAVTATVDGNSGTFEFENVEWRDEAASGNETDEESITVSVDDDEYEAASGTATPLTIVSGEEQELADDITVNRSPQDEFTATVQGSTLYRVFSGAPEELLYEAPVAGVVVTLTFTDDDGTTTLETVTNAAGNYQFFVEWTDVVKNDAADANAPTGEDALSVSLEFDAGAVPNASDVSGTIASFIVRSWIAPNSVPDRVDNTPNS